ncbi:MAG: hypothetical protein ACR2PM_02395, partial [Hyphomicrobiales bacterium]
ATNFVPAVMPSVGTMGVVMVVILLGTVYTSAGFMVLAVMAAVGVKGAIQKGLRTRRAPGGHIA